MIAGFVICFALALTVGALLALAALIAGAHSEPDRWIEECDPDRWIEECDLAMWEIEMEDAG